MNIGDRIKILRKRNELTQRELAKKIHKSPQVISNWERGYTPNITNDDIVNLARVFNVEVSDIVGSSNEESSDKVLCVNDVSLTYNQPTTPARDLLDMLFADEPEFLAKVKNIEMSGKINKPGVLAQLTDRQKERIKDIIKLTYNEALNNGGTATIRTVSSDSKD